MNCLKCGSTERYEIEDMDDYWRCLACGLVYRECAIEGRGIRVWRVRGSWTDTPEGCLLVFIGNEL